MRARPAWLELVVKYSTLVRYCTRCRYLSGEDKDTKEVQLNGDAETIPLVGLRLRSTYCPFAYVS